MKASWKWLVTCLLALVAGCTVAPDYHTPSAALPARFDTAPTSQTLPAATQPTMDVDLTRWWASLNDKELDSLVDQAVRANYDLLIASARLQEAREMEYAVTGGVISGLGKIDSGGLSAALGRGTGTNTTKSRVAGPLNAASNTQGFTEITHIVGFDAGWEIDLFGRFRREIEATEADTQAIAEARNAVLLSLVADVVRSYVDTRALQTRLAIARQGVDKQQRIARLVEERNRLGLANDLDVALARRQLSTMRSQLSPLESAIAVTERRVAVLLGKSPEALRVELEKPSMFPAPPPRVSAGMPADLLRRRPDIREMERQLAATTARIGVTTADLFPRVAITGGVGFQGQGMGRDPILSKLIWSVGPTLYWPFLDFGRLDALVKVQDYRTQQLLFDYQRGVISAVEEVDDALGNYSAQQDHTAQLSSAVDFSKKAAHLAEERYDRGLNDFLNVLDAQRQLYDLEDQYVVGQQSVIYQFIALYKALGGGWEGYEAPAAPPAPQPALFAAGRELFGPHTAPEPDRSPPGLNHH